MAVELCFPGDSIGIIFAVIELIGGISTWIFSELVIQNFSFGKFSYRFKKNISFQAGGWSRQYSTIPKNGFKRQWSSQRPPANVGL